MRNFLVCWWYKRTVWTNWRDIRIVAFLGTISVRP